MKTKLAIHPDELDEKWVNKMAENGIGTLAIHPVGGASADKALEGLLETLEDDDCREKLDYAARRGLKIAYEMHAAGYLMPRSLFASHPEYFRMDETGKRTPERNFCVSNPDAMAIVAERAAGLAKRLYRSIPEYYFWMHDSSKDVRCCCEKCRCLSASDQQLLVMNAIVRKLREEEPEAKVAYLAYLACIEPPKKVAPEPGIFLEYAPIKRDMSKPVREMPRADLENIRALLSFFGTKDSKVLEYWYDNSLFSHWKKPPVPFHPDNGMIRDDVCFYTGLGFEEISSFACYLGADYEALHGDADISALRQA